MFNFGIGFFAALLLAVLAPEKFQYVRDQLGKLIDKAKQ